MNIIKTIVSMILHLVFAGLLGFIYVTIFDDDYYNGIFVYLLLANLYETMILREINNDRR